VFPIAGWGIGVVMNAWDVYWRPQITEQDIGREIEREDKPGTPSPSGRLWLFSGVARAGPGPDLCRWRRPGDGRSAAMKTSAITLMGGGVAVVEAETDIGRSAEQVFDYASDPANEPGWNIRMKRVEKLTGGPVGVGARYRMEFTQGPAAVSECVRFERLGFWEFVGQSKIINSGFSGQVVPRGEGSHLLLRMRIRPRGPLRLALPLVRRRMQRELARDVVTIKARLEGAAQTCSGPHSQAGA
jgi:uncharacterized protein YndB with AHSA1/START domain